MKRIKRLIAETNNVVLGAGALAGAVVAVAGAVHLFQPGAPPTGILADIKDVTLETNVGLKEYEDREQTADAGVPGGRIPAPAGYRFAAYRAAGDATEPATETGSSPSTSTPETTPETAPETTPEHTTTTPTHVYKRTKVPKSTTPEDTAAEGSSGPSGVPFVKPPSPKTPFKSEGNAKTLNGTGAPTSEVEGILAEATTASGEEATPEGETAARIALPQHCDPSCAAGPTVEQVLADNPSPAQAAKEVATVFRHSRARYFDHELHPLGADVEYTLKLTGFVHNDAILEWTLWSQSENHPLPHSWWQKVIVKQVKPSRYEETVSGTFWAPLPPKPGNYVFHLAVYDEQGNRRGHGRTPVFH
jgi:hypothetical protein